MEARYLKYILAEEDKDSPLRQMVDSKKTSRTRTSHPLPMNHISTVLNETATSPLVAPVQATTLGRYLPNGFRVSTVLLDSAFRDTSMYPHANQFVVKLADAFRDVVALRLLRTEFYQPSNTTGYFVLNEVRVPLQLYNIESAYLYLNGYQSMQVANEQSTSFFGRVGPGTEMYPAVTGDIRQDPLAYMFMPAEPKLRRFQVKLLKADGSLYNVKNARVVVTLAVYCLTPGAPPMCDGSPL